MRYYVNTRGVQKECDYRWYKIREDKLIIGEPELIKDINDKQLLDESSSLVLYRDKYKQLHLLLTYLPAPQRKSDYVGRKIVNNLLWIAEESETQLLLGVAVNYLEQFEKLSGFVDNIIKESPNSEGFSVNIQALKELTTTRKLTNSFKNQKAKLLISVNTPEKRKELATKLKNEGLSDLESRYLVIVTKYTDRDILEKTCVDYALSDLIDSEKWIELSKPLSNPYNILKDLFNKKKLLIVVSILALMPAVFMTLKSSDAPSKQTHLKTNPPISSPNQSKIETINPADDLSNLGTLK